MPGFKQMLRNATGKEQRLLRGKVMECVAIIADAVCIERFEVNSLLYVVTIDWPKIDWPNTDWPKTKILPTINMTP